MNVNLSVVAVTLASVLLPGCGSGDKDDGPPSTTDSDAPDTDTTGDTDDTDDTDTTVVTDTGTPVYHPPIMSFGSGQPPKNLLMISIDTLRTDAVERHGGTGRMPYFSALADAGFSVDNARACANWTVPTTTCVVGGRSSIDLAEGTGTMPQTGYRPGPLGTYPDGVDFLATWLGQAGFYSILHTANNAFGPQRGNSQGYHSITEAPDEVAARMLANGQAELELKLSDGTILPDQPWFLHVHTYDPHRLYDPPRRFLDEVDALAPIPYDLGDDVDHNRAMQDVYNGVLSPDLEALVKQHMQLRYEGELRFLDEEIAEGWTNLEAAGLLDDTLVVFWSDHGEQFWEREMLAHAKMLHREENHMVWFFWAKDLVSGATDKPAMASDMVPTVLDLFELPIPPVVTGKPLHHISDNRTRSAFVVGRIGPVLLMEKRQWMIHWAFADPAQTNEETTQRFAGRTVFDIVADPGATNDTWDDEDPVLQGLWAEALIEAQRAEPWAQENGFEILWLE